MGRPDSGVTTSAHSREVRTSMLPRIQSGAHGILPSWKPSLRDTQTLGGSSANWSPRCPSSPQDAELPTSPLYYLMLGTESWVWAMLTALYTLRFMAHTETGMPVPALGSNLPPSPLSLLPSVSVWPHGNLEVRTSMLPRIQSGA